MDRVCTAIALETKARGIRMVLSPVVNLDTDLRWELLQGLALNGAVGAAEIDAALSADNTSNGQQAAARVRAALPTAEGKRAAFDLLTTDDTVPNVIVRAVTVGFQHVNDPSVLDDLVELYFGALNDIWTNRSYQIAETWVMGLYPAPLANQRLVDATTAWLAANPGTPALRRLVTENLAGVQRALTAQARDRA
jgi:aminopeptidase N